jgi:hypothetical protein
MKNLILFALLIVSAITLQSCDKSQANVQTLISNDCGQTWEVIQVGQIIPKRITTCELKTTLPSSPMTGTSNFKTSFKNQVLTDIKLDYEYEIVDALKFISNAKYLAKTDSDGDEVSTNSSRFESAENTIIDKRIKDISRRLLENIDIVDFDQSDFENLLLDEANKILAERGVRINFISFVPIPSEQTAQAIDVATAWRIYDSKGLQEIGKTVMSNRAGANKIIISSEQVKAEVPQ